jgi:hypothetical protein
MGDLEELRRGRFYLMDDFIDTTGLDRLGQIFAAILFVPLHIDHDFAQRRLAIGGHSPMFCPVQKGQFIPEYTIVLSAGVDKDHNFLECWQIYHRDSQKLVAEGIFKVKEHERKTV